MPTRGRALKTGRRENAKGEGKPAAWMRDGDIGECGRPGASGASSTFNGKGIVVGVRMHDVFHAARDGLRLVAAVDRAHEG